MEAPIGGTLADALVRAADLWPNDVGWVFEDRRVTRAQMLADADRVAATLVARGVEPGDRVAVWLPNRVEWAQLLFGCARIGAVLVSLNTRWKSFEAGYVIEHASPRLVVVQRHLLNIDFADLLADLGWPAGTGVGAGLDVVEVEGPGGAQLPGATPWSEFLDEGAAVPHQTVLERSSRLMPTDPVLLQYTSGSTARPKGALIAQRAVLNYGVEVVDRLGMVAGEAYLNPQPLYHVAGSCLALPVPLSRPIRSVMPYYYEALRVLELTEREGCVARGGTPTMYLDEMNHPQFDDIDTSSLRAGWVGAPPAVLDRIHAGYPVEGLVNLYAATEGGGTWGNATDRWEVRRLSTGRALTGTELRIRDLGSGGEAPTGEVGEIGFRGWNQLLEYFNDEQKTAEAFDAEGYVYLGDLGYVDETGHLYYVGRIKDMIRSGGENVAAEEVETFLAEHPLIRQVAVIGRPDDRMGEVVVAVVEPVAPGAISEAEVIEHCRGRLAGFRTPKAVHFVEEWPATSSGKIHKPTLRERFR